MRIGDLLSRQRPVVSFEFFPPKTDDGVEKLMATVRQLRDLDPAFVSVTYGAGGSSRARTLEVVKRLKAEAGIEPMAHVTCVGHTCDELRELFSELQRSGIENVMALRGDPPKGEDRFVAADGGFAYASDLIAMLSREFSFSVGAAAYPETHPEAHSSDADIENAVRKVRAGAEFLTTQFFFENDAYFSYVYRLREAGVEVPVVPGIMPITNYEAVARMLTMNGGRMPARLAAEIELRRDDPAAVADLGVAFCALQCRELLDRGAPGLHFYTLNRSPSARAVVSALIATRTLPEPANLRAAT